MTEAATTPALEESIDDFADKLRRSIEDPAGEFERAKDAEQPASVEEEIPPSTGTGDDTGTEDDAGAQGAEDVESDAPAPQASGGGDHVASSGAVQASTSAAPVGSFEMVAIDKIVPSPDNPRRKLGDLSQMVASIRAVGVIEPLLIEERTADELVDDDDHPYRVVAGHRRHEAARLADVVLVPCLIRAPIEDDLRVELMLIENLQREDLVPLDEAQGFRRLTELGLTQRTIAERVGCSQAHVSKRIALLDLPQEAQAALDSGGITATEAGELVKLKDHPKLVAEVLKDSQKGGAWYDVGELVARSQQRIRNDEKREKIKADAKKKGWPVLTPPKSYNERPDYRKIAKADGGYYGDALVLDLKAHRKEPCHGLLIEESQQGPKGVDVCTDPKRHAAKGASDLKLPPKAKPEPNEHEVRQREEQRAKNAASERRLVHLQPVLAKKVAQAKVVPLIARALIEYLGYDTKKIAGQLLGFDSGNYDETRARLFALADEGPDALLRVALACVLARGESDARVAYGMWEDRETVSTLYAFLVDTGYELNEFETAKLEEKALRAAEAATARAQVDALIEASDLPTPVKDAVRRRMVESSDADPVQFLQEAAEDGDTVTLTWWFEVCRKCGCTSDRACEGGCSWVEEDLCSTCNNPEPAES